MLVLRNTQKVSKALGIKPKDLMDTTNIGYLGDWFCNEIMVDRRRCLIFCHSLTLYSFFVPGITQKSFSVFTELFYTHLAKNLEYEGFAEVTITNLINKYKTSTLFSKTNSRSVLGTMNDYAYLFDGYEEPLGPARCDLLAVNQKVNTAPMKPLNYSSGIQEMKRHLMRVAL